MRLLPRPCRSSFRTLSTFLSVVVLGAVSVGPASAQNGVIAFQDGCDGRLYGMRGDSSDRMPLPLPPLPGPASEYRYSMRLLDVTTSGPVTAIYFVAINRRDGTIPADVGLFAVPFHEVDGVLTPDDGGAVRLSLPSDVDGGNPNTAGSGAFSPTADPDGPDRMALVIRRSDTTALLVTMAVDRDPTTSRITGLSDPIVVSHDLYALGVPDPKAGVSGSFGDAIDYAPDGFSIVSSSNNDLWRHPLGGDHRPVGAPQRLTTNTDGFAEWNPSLSPDGSRVAYTAGLVSRSGGVSSRDMDIFTLDLITGITTRVTTNKNKGEAASGRDRAMWTEDSAWIGFTAYTSSTPRRAPCSTFVNTEIFLIKANGSGIASQITHTNGTSVEAFPKWGW